MTAVIFKPEAIIPEESFNPDKLQEPLVDLFSIIPRKTHKFRDYFNLDELRRWQADYRNRGIPFAVCKHQRKGKTVWRLWKHQAVDYKSHETQAREDIKEVNGVSTTCKCPLCGETHQQVMLWTGRGVPRTCCPACAQSLSHLSAGVDGGSNFNSQAARHIQISTQP